MNSKRLEFIVKHTNDFSHPQSCTKLRRITNLEQFHGSPLVGSETGHFTDDFSNELGMRRNLSSLSRSFRDTLVLRDMVTLGLTNDEIVPAKRSNIRLEHRLRILLS